MTNAVIPETVYTYATIILANEKEELRLIFSYISDAIEKKTAEGMARNNNKILLNVKNLKASVEKSMLDF